MDERVRFLIDWLTRESDRAAEAVAAWSSSGVDDRQVLRALTNMRPAVAVPQEVLAAETALLADELAQVELIDAMALPTIADQPRLALWRGDITRLRVDAIVNAANSALLGCFAPLHRCIDNAIHSAAGMGLRGECARIMAGGLMSTGTAVLTGGYCLPAGHVLHTVGPIIRGPVTNQDESLLASCYTSCLQTAVAAGLASVAFCCISTGEFGYPKQAAARTAIDTVRAELAHHPSIERVVFNVFTEQDHAIYRDLLGPDG